MFPCDTPSTLKMSQGIFYHHIDVIINYINNIYSCNSLNVNNF